MDLLVEGQTAEHAPRGALQGELEDLLGRQVHIVATAGLSTPEDTRERIVREAVGL